MLDAAARKLIDPPLNLIGRRLARLGWNADAVTLAGLGIGLGAAASIAFGHLWIALLLLIVSRIADGLDGAIARAGQSTDFGGYLDITCDFLFYGAIPLGFAVLAPELNALPAAFLLASFYFNGASFLGYAILAEKRGMRTSDQGIKSLYFSNGLLEGTETIVLFILFCLFPTSFPSLAWSFGTLCFITASVRIWGARQIFLNSKATS